MTGACSQVRSSSLPSMTIGASARTAIGSGAVAAAVRSLVARAGVHARVAASAATSAERRRSGMLAVDGRCGPKVGVWDRLATICDRGQSLTVFGRGLSPLLSQPRRDARFLLIAGVRTPLQPPRPAWIGAEGDVDRHQAVAARNQDLHPVARMVLFKPVREP